MTNFHMNVDISIHINGNIPAILINSSTCQTIDIHMKIQRNKTSIFINLDMKISTNIHTIACTLAGWLDGWIAHGGMAHDWMITWLAGLAS